MLKPSILNLFGAWPLALALVVSGGCGAADGPHISPNASEFIAVPTQQGASTTAVLIKPTSETKQCLAVAGNEAQDGAPVVVEPCHIGDPGQAWEMVKGQLRIFGDKCLDVVSGRDRDGTGLQVWTCGNDNKNQRWTWRGQALQWKDHGRCLDLTDSNKQAGTRMQIWSCQADNDNQKWRISKAVPTRTNEEGGTDIYKRPGTDTLPASTNNKPAGTNEGSEAADEPQAEPEQAGQVLTVKGEDLIDAQGQKVVLRGTNSGGWLVTENWMTGFSDTTDGTGRFARETLERRFGEAQTDALFDAWYDQWLTETDLDNAKSLGINTLRLPFGWRNLQHADGSWRQDEAGNIDFRRMDWLIAEAQKRELYVVLVLHLWDGQQDEYGDISGSSPAGKKQQKKAAAIWEAVAKHYANNASVAAYDLINEPTGSAGNQLQDVLYRAVRAHDDRHAIVMESVSSSPKDLGWTKVIYSFHQYSMMGPSFTDNQASFKKDASKKMIPWSDFSVPVYIGEFMAQQDGKTLPWMIKQYNQRTWHWTSWTLKTVNMGSWGLFNVPASFRLDINQDSYETMVKKIKQMPKARAQTPLADIFKQSVNAK